MRCKYRVTCDDRAWNEFLKKGLLASFASALNSIGTVTFLVGPHLELRDFRSARSRALTKLPPIARQKQREKKKMLKSSNRSATMETVTPVANDTVTNLTSVVTPFFERAVDLAFERIAAECAYQREVKETFFP
jgi:hypothetical protein